MNQILAEKYQRRFLDRLSALDEEEGGHWAFEGGKTNGGYPCFWTGTRMVTAHRLAYEIFVAPVPAGEDVDHLCRVRWCCNPDHLEPCSRSENLRRGMGPEMARERAAAATHCSHGHPWSENTYRLKGGGRACLTCKREFARKYLRQAREAKLRGDER